MDKFLRNQGISSGSETRVSLDQFRKTTQEYLTRIAQIRQPLQEISNLFQGKGDLRPVHCKQALDSLEMMNACIEEFGGLFYKTAHLPLVIVAIRYRSLFILHHIEGQASRLEELLDRFRTVCMTPSRQAQKQRKIICDSFESLLGSLDDISQQVRVLNDEARFQEGKLIAMGER